MAGAICSQTDHGGYTDADAWFLNRYQTLSNDFKYLTDRAKDFDSKTNSVIRTISDSFYNAADYRKRFREEIKEAGIDLQRAEDLIKKGGWKRAFDLFSDSETRLKRAAKEWKSYINATSEGAESVAGGLGVVRNSAAGLVLAGGAALAVGAGGAVAAALAASSGLHAGALSLFMKEKKPARTTEVIMVEIISVDPEGEDGSSGSSGNGGIGEVPTTAASASAGVAQPKKIKNIEAPKKISKKVGEPKEKEAEAKPAFSLRMRSDDADEKDDTNDTNEAPQEKRIPLSKLYPSEEALQKIIDPSQAPQEGRLRVAVQDPTGTYNRYEDESVLVRNPELGINAVSDEASTDSRISVDKNGNVSGVADRGLGRQGKGDFIGKVDTGLLARNSGRISSVCDFYKGSSFNPEFFNTLNIFIDSSGSMGSNFYIAPSTTCAYQAAVSALKAKSVVRVFNFSERTYATEKTTNEDQIAKAISRFEGSGTLLPTGILEPIKEEPVRNDIVIISDGYIANYEMALPYFQGLLNKNPQNRGYFVIIGGNQSVGFDRNKCIELFRNIGFKVIFHG